MDTYARRRRKPRKSCKLNLRITGEMKQALDDACAAMHGMDVSDYVRHAVGAMLDADAPLVEAVRRNALRQAVAMPPLRLSPDELIAAYDRAHPRANAHERESTP